MGNTININGKLYDSDTGEPVNTPKPAKSAKKSIISRSKFTKAKPSKSTTKQPSDKTTKTEKPVTKPAKRAHAHGLDASSKLQRTKTLRRKQLAKPPKKTKPKSAASSLRLVSSSAAKASPKLSSASTSRSPLISKFSSNTPKRGSNIDSIGPAGKPTKAASTKSEKSSPSNKPKLSAKDELIYKKMAEIEAEKPVKRTKKSSRKIKLSIIIVAIVAVVLTGAILVYTHIPNASVWLASYRAGFDAVLPHYTPDGFRYSAPVKYESDQITINFRSNTDNRHYSITEQPTQWDPEAVYDNYVKQRGNEPPYTINDSGLTIYIFNNSSSAAWVNGGKLFVIDGTNAKLSPQQLQQIATSL